MDKSLKVGKRSHKMSMHEEKKREEDNRQGRPSAVSLARRLARLLDTLFVLPGGVRIGLDPLLGLLPGIGDTLASFTGAMILLLATRCRVPRIVLARMALNVLLNGLIGAIPGIGDLFSFWFKSNLRNAELLERYTREDTPRSTAGDWGFVLLVLGGVLAILVGVLFGVVWLSHLVWQHLRGA